MGRGARNMTFGAGRASGSFINSDSEWEKRVLSDKADALQRELEGVRNRLNDMDAKKE
jgi:hypothetical protein